MHLEFLFLCIHLFSFSVSNFLSAGPVFSFVRRIQLEAAHIKPYSDNSPHLTENGLLLRSDLHTLFDDGYITIAPDYHIEVSKRLHEDYGNGKDYYKYHGSKLLVLPQNEIDLPSSEYLEWHNNEIYRG